MLEKLFGKTTPKKHFDDPAKNHGATEFEVDNWIISDFVVNKLVPVVGFHPFPLNELMLMTASVCRFRPALIFEWGTNIGKSARIFYEISKAFQVDCEIHSIDLPDDIDHNEHPRNNRGMMVKGIDMVTLHQADGLDRSFEIIEKRNKGGNVLFFVDGDHSYESVRRELSTILSKMPDAKVLLHDTFYQSDLAGYNIGPFKAIQEVLAGKTGYKTIATNMGLPGMTLVYRDAK